MSEIDDVRDAASTLRQRCTIQQTSTTGVDQKLDGADHQHTTNPSSKEQEKQTSTPFQDDDVHHLDHHHHHHNHGSGVFPRKKPQALLLWKDMPRHLQFNPYIHTGYRPLLSAWGCINSLFYMHNETVNILSHAVPILYILFTVPTLLPWSQAELRFLSWCHFAGILCPWVGSFVYHLFMNLEKDEVFYHRLLQLDMFGIWISQSFGAMPMVMATTFCLPRILRWFCISTYCLLSLWGLYKAMTAWSPWERRLCFLLPFIMRILLWGLRVSSYGGGDPAAFQHVILQDVVSIVGGAIGALHIPEKWFPGSVDMYLNSHNIMHVLVVTAVYSMHIATMKDLSWMSRVKCSAAL